MPACFELAELIDFERREIDVEAPDVAGGVGHAS